MNLERKINCALTLSATSLIIVVAIIGLWIFKSQEIAVVTLDTFVGVIVALLAIIVTVAIGWQIWAAMDMKSNIAKLDIRLQEIESLKKQFGQQQKKIEQLSLKNQHLTGYTWGKSSFRDGSLLAAFRCFILSLSSSLQLEAPMNVESILAYLSEISTNIDAKTKCVKKYYTEIVEANKKIRSLQNFSLIAERYTTSYDTIFSKLEIDDDQK